MQGFIEISPLVTEKKIFEVFFFFFGGGGGHDDRLGGHVT